MKIISDIHLDNGRDGDFTHFDKGRLNAFLDFVGDDDLIINGDLLDIWRWPVKEILEAHQGLIKRLTDKKNVSLILGNHDLFLDIMERIFQREVFNELKIQGRVVIHGYQFDWRLDTPEERRIVAAGCRAIERLGCSLLGRAASWIASAPRSNEPIKKRIQELRPSELFVCAHSHVPVSEGWYINDGACCTETMTYVDNGFNLKEWNA